MDISRYRYFAAVARTGNFTRAAEELHISQPALTKAIKRTEEEMGILLFDRDSAPLRLTYAGERFLAESGKILHLQENLEEEMARIATGRQGKVSIGVPVESASTWLPMILPEFMARNPDVEIKIVEGYSDSFERELLAGTLDLSIYTLPVHSQELDYDVVGEHPIFLVTSPEHRFSREIDLPRNGLRTPHYLEPSRLEGEKLLTLTPNRGMYRVAMQLLERHGVKMNIALQLTSNYTVSTLAAAGLGFCFTTLSAGLRMEAAPYLHPVFFTLDNPVFTRKTIVAYKKGYSLSSAAQAMIDLAKIKLTLIPGEKINVVNRIDDKKARMKQ